jgi:hypothetical protein
MTNFRTGRLFVVAWRRLTAGLSRLPAETDLALALLLAIPALLPLTAPGYFFNAHDGRHSVFWLFEFDAAFRDGALWPIWVPDHVLGFGYPLWLVYTPLAFFVAEAFHLLGFGLVGAVKLAWAFWFIVGALGIYRLARRWWGTGPALVASLAYTYAPYHLVDIYVRAAYAEFAALAIAPWALLGVIRAWEEPRPRTAALAALALGALLLTHGAAPAVFVPLVVGLAVWKTLVALIIGLRSASPGRGLGSSVRVHLRPILWSGIAFGLGLGLALIFWLPALLERRYIQEASWLRGAYDYARHFVYPSQFLSAFWGFGFSTPGPGDGMSFGLGLLPWIMAAVAALATVGLARPSLRSHRAETIFLIVVSLAAIFAMTPASAPAWAAFPLAASVQFPWRFLAVTTICLALLTAAGVRWLEEVCSRGAGSLDAHKGLDYSTPIAHSTPPDAQTASRSPITYGLALLIVLASFPYTQPELAPIRLEDESVLAIVEFEAKYPDMRGMTSFAQRNPSEATSPLIAQYVAGQPLQRAAIVAGAGKVLDQAATANSARARVRADDPVRLRFYTNYFPGWQATVDGQPVEIAPDPPDGLIGLDLLPGEHEVRLRFTATPVRQVGLALSIIAALSVVALLVWSARRDR